MPTVQDGQPVELVRIAVAVVAGDVELAFVVESVESELLGSKHLESLASEPVGVDSDTWQCYLDPKPCGNKGKGGALAGVERPKAVAEGALYGLAMAGPAKAGFGVAGVEVLDLELAADGLLLVGTGVVIGNSSKKEDCFFLMAGDGAPAATPPGVDLPLRFIADGCFCKTAFGAYGLFTAPVGGA
ncbi:hypothetical protein WICPIJ_000100 [Wickerhamomyces pijperi]|uniref:Uncharacterized protein n=1 Tax=Wickerhamomyces pijperi TaxID=599730 RepID=A0A9P8QEG3_WICPI|nr:hypothetical protein WICPIJ_000100 [Wickerhamomyces pijperi]